MNANNSTACNVRHEHPTTKIARDYLERGWALTPVQFRGKQPVLTGWQSTKITQDGIDQHFGSGQTNIGIVLGDLSHGLVDIDIDDPVALQFAEKILPDTDCVFGHRSSPRSHWIYQAASVGRIEAFVVAGQTIIEVRGNAHLTVFPGSTHCSGETIEFEKASDPSKADWDELQKAARKIAI
jgi:hypothetical protein